MSLRTYLRIKTAGMYKRSEVEQNSTNPLYDIQTNEAAQQQFLNEIANKPADMEWKPTTLDLTPETIDDPNVNPFLQYRGKLGPEHIKDERSLQLFGLPTIEAGRDLDSHLISNNIDKDITWRINRYEDFDDKFVTPLLEASSEALGFKRQEGNNYFDDITVDVPYSVRKSQAGYGSKQPIPYAINNLAVLRGDIVSENGSDRVDFKTYPNSEFFSGDDIDVANEPTVTMGHVLTPDQKAYVEAYQRARAQALALAPTIIRVDGYPVNADREYLEQKYDVKGDSYRKYRNNLMHAYIDKTPVGKAFKAYPSLITGVPYAAYHALPYADIGNRPAWVNAGINAARKQYKKLTK